MYSFERFFTYARQRKTKKQFPHFFQIGLSKNSSNVLSAAQVYRSVSISLTTETKVLCEPTEETKTTWEILKLEDDPRTIPSNVPLADLRKTLFNTIEDNQEFSLPGKLLPYGFYEVRAKVEMKGIPDVLGSDTIFVQVVQTPWLNAAVKDGSFHTVPFGMMVSNELL